MVEKRGRKAQVTMFIILGLVILLAVSISIYYLAQTRLFLFEQKLPSQYAPVQTFVKNCIESVSTDAVNLAGAKGGYVRTPVELSERGAYLRVSREAGFNIPYWYQRGNIYPELDDIETHITLYIKENLEKCIDFSALDEFDVEVLNKPIIRVRIGDGVVVEVKYPVNVKVKGSEQVQKIENYRVEVPVRLKLAYELARKILDEDNKGAFLERQMWNIISVHPDVPVTGPEWSCKPLRKPIANIKDTVKNVVNYNLADIRVNNTRFTGYVPGDKDYAGHFLIWDLERLQRKFSDLSVSFDYELEYPMQMYVSPNDRAFLRAEPVKLFDLIPLCYVQYHFTYDLEFPITVTITDFETNEHNAYSFTYAFPLMINHNQPDRVNIPTHLVDNIIPVYDSSFCENYPRRQLSIEARDKVTNRPVNHVAITSQCVQYVCDIGEITSQMGVYKLDAMFPECKRATITAFKQGYLDSQIIVDTTIDNTGIKTIHMMPVKAFNFTVVKHPLSDVSVQEGIPGDELVALTIKNSEHGFEENNFFINKPVEQGVITNTINLLNSWTYEYELELSLLKGEDIIGGYKANWTVPWRDVISNNNIIFHVFEEPEALDSDELMFDLVMNMHLNSTKIPKPELIP